MDTGNIMWCRLGGFQAIYGDYGQSYTTQCDIIGSQLDQQQITIRPVCKSNPLHNIPAEV